MKNPRRKWFRQGGFSLVELLIAGVIIAMTSSLLIGGLVSANRSGELRASRAIATQLLAGRLALIDDAVDSQSPDKGSCAEPYENSTWVLEKQDTLLASVKRIELTVTHEGHDIHVATYRRLKEPPQ